MGLRILLPKYLMGMVPYVFLLLCMTSSSAPLCTIGVGFELSWSSCQIFDGTANFVAQIFDGNGSLCIFAVVHDWICLICSLVVQCGQLT